MSERQLSTADSTNAMQSLLTAYADNEVDEDDSITEQHPGAGLISDDDDEAHRKDSSLLNKSNSRPDSRLSDTGETKIDDESPPPEKKLHRTQSEVTTASARTSNRLVSYIGEDETDSDEDESDAPLSNTGTPVKIFGESLEKIQNGASVASKEDPAEALQDFSQQSPSSTTEKDTLLPPEPPGKCSKKLQEKVEKLYQKMLREGRNLNYEIQKRKDFRNPSIYEKIVEFCGIDEKGTNYPPELYHPDNWILDENSYYDKLGQAQADLMQKKEKEAKKSKVERQVGIKKTASEPVVNKPHP